MLWHFQRESGLRVDQSDQGDYTGAKGAAAIAAERNHPVADVYWSGDAIYGEILKQDGLTAPYHTRGNIPIEFRDPQDHWTGMAGRARVLLVRSILKDRPQSIRDLANPLWKGRAVMTSPLVGTTRTHFAALAAAWGDQELASFYKSLLQNGTLIAQNAEEAANLVISGERDFALIDTDVASERIIDNAPVEMVYPDYGKTELGVMIIPNAVMILKGSGDKQGAEMLVDFLTSPDLEARLCQLDLSRTPLHPGVAIRSLQIRRYETYHVMNFDYSLAAKKHKQMEQILGITK
jgi:iron(III) transport system substrate-binding protein